MIMNKLIGLPLEKMPPLYTHINNGQPGRSSLFTAKRQDGTVDWELVLFQGGTLTFSRVVPSIDVFLVAPGANGKGGVSGSNTYNAYGGAGGAGGEAKTFSGISVSPGVVYSVTVGNTGEVTTAFNKTVTRGGGASGGSGGSQVNRTVKNPDGGDRGVLAFGSSSSLIEIGGQSWSGRRFGAGGGGGRARNSHCESTTASAAGGNHGGGASGQDGDANTGGGGGGGIAYWPNTTDGYNGAGGKGGSGIIIIRNHR